ncbi:MAG: penicillin-binding protein [Chlorobi bacterium]|nr:penicillin-binding protein [Chlorobiota bacterium]
MAKSSIRYKIYIVIFWIIIIFPFVFFTVLFTRISQGKLGAMPTFKELENPKNNLASVVYSSDDKVLGKYYIQNRTSVNYDDLSPYLINSLIATEDIRFKKHAGIDEIALLRVLYGIFSGNVKGGGSTITQQLAKNLFPRDTTIYKSKIKKYNSLILAKFKEWVTAVKLERNYTKEEILVMYLNTIPFGSNAFGIKSASRIFFNETPKTIKLEQAALLIGVLNAPTRYSPIRHPERALKKRNLVLKQMFKYNYISKEEYDSIRMLPLHLKFRVPSHNQGLATYFREYLRQKLKASKPVIERYYSYKDYKEDSIKWITDPLFGWCNKHFKPDSSNYNLYSDGLRIYTTINSKMQEYAEEAVREHLIELQDTFNKVKAENENGPFSKDLKPDDVEYIMELAMKRTERYRLLKLEGLTQEEIQQNFDKKVEMTVFSWEGDKDTVMSPMDSLWYYKYFLHAGFMSMEPNSGYVRAYVGGIDHKYFKFDNVMISKRQVGSTFKPFLYTLAMQEGYSPCYKIPNTPTTFILDNGDIWTPSKQTTRYDRKMITLKMGLAKSINNISAWLMKQFKPKAVIDIARIMGVKSYIPPVPSIILGTADLTLYEMVGAYNTFADKGVYTEPIFVTRIEDKNGNVLDTFKPKKNEAISENTAYLMINLLEGVVRFGTSVRLWAPSYPYRLNNEIAGKTGTTENNSDGWFIGITPKLVSGAWVGGELRSVHFDNISLGQGANMALPIWALYMKKVYADSTLGISTKDTFEKPLYGFDVEIDCDKYERENNKSIEEVPNKEENEFF